MAYLLTHFWPGATVDEYKASIAAVHPPGGLPEGQTYHAAGPTGEASSSPPCGSPRSNPTASSKTSCCRACPSTGALRASRRSARPRS